MQVNVLRPLLRPIDLLDVKADSSIGTNRCPRKTHSTWSFCPV
jgi:hypothetical protein